MNQLSSRDRLEISVENFGPIAEAKIDLRPLTLFIGPSNSGKSCFSTLIYALHHALGAAYRSVYHSKGFKWSGSEGVILDLQSWFGGHFPDFASGASAGRNSKPTQKRFQLPEEISSLVRLALKDNLHSNSAVKDEFERCFGTKSARSLIRQAEPKGGDALGSATVVLKKITKTQRGSMESFAYNFEFDARSFRSSLDISPGIPLCIGNPLYDPTAMGFSVMLSGNEFSNGQICGNPSHQEIGAHLANSVFSNLIDPIERAVHYLPSDRAGVMRVHRLISKAALKRMSKAGINTPAFSGVLADFLEQLVDINDGPVFASGGGSYSRFFKEYFCRRAPAEQFALLRSVAKDLELSVLGGGVHSKVSDNSVASDSNFFYTPGEWSSPLPLMCASSMVSELSPIVLYLRHVVAPGNVLIIEEPESHLHPELQIEFINLLTEIIKARVRIILTTHSVSILDAVANLVLSSEADKQSGKDTAGLTKQDVGLWSFAPKTISEGSIVREISFDHEGGGFSTELDDAAAKLHNSWAEIDSRIHKGIS